MKKEIFQEIDVPEGVETNIEGSMITIKGPKGEIKKSFHSLGLVFQIEDKKIIIGSKKATKSEKKIINTIAAHIKNIIKGVQEKFEYKLKVCNSHFPMSVELKDKEVTIKNFLGEKIPRVTNMPEGVEVEINKDIITVKSIDKELAGQAAANFEKATRVTNKDRRVFQDGIFITSKAGKDI